jgi:hypothetical protein
MVRIMFPLPTAMIAGDFGQEAGHLHNVDSACGLRRAGTRAGACCGSGRVTPLGFRGFWGQSRLIIGRRDSHPWRMEAKVGQTARSGQATVWGEREGEQKPFRRGWPMGEILFAEYLLI